MSPFLAWMGQIAFDERVLRIEKEKASGSPQTVCQEGFTAERLLASVNTVLGLDADSSWLSLTSPLSGRHTFL